MMAGSQIDIEGETRGTWHSWSRATALAVVVFAGMLALALLSGASAEEPPCLTAVDTEHEVQVIAAWPEGRPRGDRASVLSAITEAVRQADEYLAASGPGHRIHWACDDGGLTVLDVTVPAGLSDGTVTFADVVGAVVERGHDREDRLYAIFYPPGAGYDEVGEATGPGDASKGPQYSMIVEWTGYWTLHEVGHTLGAVPSRAPHQFAKGHCHELNDVMCRRVQDLDDPTYGDLVEMNCPRGPEWLFDCNHDDYYLHEGDWWDVADSPYLYLAPPEHRPAPVPRPMPSA